MVSPVCRTLGVREARDEEHVKVEQQIEREGQRGTLYRGWPGRQTDRHVSRQIVVGNSAVFFWFSSYLPRTHIDITISEYVRRAGLQEENATIGRRARRDAATMIS